LSSRIPRACLAAAGYSEDLCRIGDVTRIDLPDSSFDAVLCLGVLPHIQRLDVAVAELARVARPGATLILSFRNDLFDLFTFNRLTVEFFADHFLPLIPTDAANREKARGLLEGMITNPTLPPPHYTGGGDASFGHITRINHNPLTIGEQLRPFGLQHELNGFYKFHPLPPILEPHFPEYRQWGAEMDETMSFSFGWQGLFMCSTFVSVFRKAG
jgi:SAM-dependent methyltransferase